MTNPIPVETRGWLYVGGLVLAAVCLIVSAVLSVLGQTQWQPVVAVVGSSVGGLIATLARANLTTETDEG